MSSRRDFIKQTSLAAAGVYVGTMGINAKSYARIIGANDRVHVGVVGFSDRFRSTLLPCFQNHYKELNFDIVALSDLWKIRREEGEAHLKATLQHDVKAFRNNDELYASKSVDAVIISTADFQLYIPLKQLKQDVMLTWKSHLLKQWKITVLL
jgi:hypothetical protein